MAGEIQIGGTTFATESGGTVTVSNVDSATNRTNLGLGSMATQNANAVALTGGSLTGTVIDLKSSGTTIYKSDGTTAVLSESGGVVTLNNGTIGSGVTFPAGLVINHNFTTYSPSAGSASVPTSETYYFQTSITPASSSNFIYCLCVVNGQDNAGAGRLTTLVKYSTTSGSGGTNTQLGSNAIASDNNAPTSNMYSGTILNRVTGLVAGTTYYFKLFARKDDGANANSAYINRYAEANPSSIYVWEVQG